MHIKKIFRLFLALPVILIFLTGCGPSQKEKMRIAETACATIFETRKFESAKRIEVLNKAREEVGDYDGPYPLSDDYLWTSLTLGGKQSCIDKIIKPPPPPPKTKAELEAEAAAAEARAKRAEEERIAKEKAEAEAKRKAEEKAKYIAENTKSTYLYCPSLEEKIVPAKIQWEKTEYGYNEDGTYGLIVVEPEKILEPEKNLGPVKIALVELKKIQGDKTKLEELDISNEFLGITSEQIIAKNRIGGTIAYWDIPMFKSVSNYCSSSGFRETVAGEDFCLGEYVLRIPKQVIWNVDEYSRAARSSSFGNPVLKWGYNDFYLDRKTLLASDSSSYLGHATYYFDSQYQCSVVTKDVYEQKIKETSDRVKVVADKYRARLEEKQSEETQI